MNRLIQTLQTPRYLAIAVALASAVIVGAALVSEYGFGLKPCILCLYQRVPYYINIALGLAAFVLSYRYPRLAILILSLTVLSFAADTAIAGFHVGVEHKWWPGLPECGGKIVPEHVSIDELRNSMERQAIVRCDEPAFVLFGISMAGYNCLISLALVFGVTYFLRKKHAA
jgi:disulfide bond formation protein DsbB